MGQHLPASGKPHHIGLLPVRLKRGFRGLGALGGGGERGATGQKNEGGLRASWSHTCLWGSPPRRVPRAPVTGETQPQCHQSPMNTNNAGRPRTPFFTGRNSGQREINVCTDMCDCGPGWTGPPPHEGLRCSCGPSRAFPDAHAAGVLRARPSGHPASASGPRVRPFPCVSPAAGPCEAACSPSLRQTCPVRVTGGEARDPSSGL